MKVAKTILLGFPGERGIRGTEPGLNIPIGNKHYVIVYYRVYGIRLYLFLHPNIYPQRQVCLGPEEYFAAKLAVQHWIDTYGGNHETT